METTTEPAKRASALQKCGAKKRERERDPVRDTPSVALSDRRDRRLWVNEAGPLPSLIVSMLISIRRPINSLRENEES